MNGYSPTRSVGSVKERNGELKLPDVARGGTPRNCRGLRLSRGELIGSCKVDPGEPGSKGRNETGVRVIGMMIPPLCFALNLSMDLTFIRQ